MISSRLITDFFDSFYIDFRQTVVNDVAGEQIDAPCQSLFDLG